MTDEIVTRLREQVNKFRIVVGVNENVIIPSLELEAADEIERLRAELDKWHGIAKEAYATAWNATIGYMNDWCFPEKGTDEYEAYRMSMEAMDNLRSQWEAMYGVQR